MVQTYFLLFCHENVKEFTILTFIITPPDFILQKLSTFAVGNMLVCQYI